MDFRLSRADARKHVIETDAALRKQMPIFRDRPPLDEDAIASGLASASARNAFWRSRSVPRPIDEALAGATFGQKLVYCVPYSDSEIRNGGFHQWFSNSTGDFAMAVLECLSAIGELERAKLVRQAMSRFPNGVAPRAQAERQRLLGAIDYRSDWRTWIEPIEDAYYALGSDELYQRLTEYVASHPHEFFLDALRS